MVEILKVSGAPTASNGCRVSTAYQAGEAAGKNLKGFPGQKAGDPLRAEHAPASSSWGCHFRLLDCYVTYTPIFPRGTLSDVFWNISAYCTTECAVPHKNSVQLWQEGHGQESECCVMIIYLGIFGEASLHLWYLQYLTRVGRIKEDERKVTGRGLLRRQRPLLSSHSLYKTGGGDAMYLMGKHE